MKLMWAWIPRGASWVWVLLGSVLASLLEVIHGFESHLDLRTHLWVQVSLRGCSHPVPLCLCVCSAVLSVLLSYLVKTERKNSGHDAIPLGLLEFGLIVCCVLCLSLSLCQSLLYSLICKSVIICTTRDRQAREQWGWGGWRGNINTGKISIGL